MQSVTEWLKHNEPTRQVTTFWRRMLHTGDPHRDSIRKYHRCHEFGKPVCKCGLSADRVGHLSPDIVSFNRRPTLACGWWMTTSSRKHPTGYAGKGASEAGALVDALKRAK